MRRLTVGLLGGALALAAPMMAHAQTIDAGPVEVRLTGYAQIQWNTTSVDETDIAGGFGAVGIDDEIAWSTFETRRIRPTIEVVIDDWIVGKIQPDFALGDLDLQDAYMNLAVDDAFELRIGQFKKPFSTIELTSSSRLVPIERGARIRGLTDALRVELDPDDPVLTHVDGDLVAGDQYELLDELGYVGRDIGIAAHGAFGRLGYAAGIFNGSGADRRDENDGKSLAGRVRYAPTADWPLAVGAAASYRELRFDGTVDDTEVEADVDGLAFEVDAEWGGFRRPGLHAILEGTLGRNFAGRVIDDGGAGRLDGATLLGVQGIAAWFEPRDGGRVEGIEPLLRVSYGDPSTERAGDGGLLVTPGINLYFFGRNRVMLNWDVFIAGGEFDTEHALRAMAQLHY